MAEARDIAGRAAALAAPVVRRLGCELVDCRYANEGGRWILRVILEKEGGISLNDCVAVSEELSPLLDVEDFIPHSYHLEISSPGVDRPLREPEDFVRFAGRRVWLQTSRSIRGRRRFQGILDGLEDDTVMLHGPGGDRIRIPLSEVKSARLDPEL